MNNFLKLSKKCEKIENLLQKMEINMNKKTFYKHIAQKTGVQKNLVERVFYGFETALLDALQKGENVNIIGFVKFSTKQRAKREYVNFQTGETFIAPAKTIPTVKFSKKFTEKL